VQPADITVALRRRSPWEAMDLGLAMLQRWWRPVYFPHLFTAGLVAVLAMGLARILEKPWVALALLWWLKPLYDRVVLHVLSRAVFGEVLAPRAVLAGAREWLGTGLLGALTFGRFDTARSFNLPVRQLEGQAGGAGRSRKHLLGRRVSGYAVWLTVVCLHFEAVLYWSLQRLTQLFLPATALDGREFFEALYSGDVLSYGDLLAYAAAVLALEPFYVAAGFALYLNRRTALEGWDIEVALRQIAQRHAAAVAAMVLIFLGCLWMPMPSQAADKNPREEIAEVLKAPEFPHYRETQRWVPRDPRPAKESRDERAANGDSGWLGGIGYALAKGAEVLFWALAACALAYALWWAARMLPRSRAPSAEPYRAPASLFGMELAPEKLPPDIAAAALALARAGKVREALGLLYRGALSDLVHRRGVELLASHTEAEALAVACTKLNVPGGLYLETLVKAWRESAYARRDPALRELERLAQDYRSFAA
jgi:hypothetical protein